MPDMDTVSRKALLEWLKKEFYSAKNRNDEGAMIAYQNLKYAIDINEIQFLPSTESEGEAALRVENERLRAELEDERRQHHFERDSHDITRESLSSTSETAVQRQPDPIRDNCATFKAPGQFTCQCPPGTCRDSGIKDGRESTPKTKEEAERR